MLCHVSNTYQDSPGWDLGAPAPQVQVYFLFFLSKNEGWNLDLISTIQHTCWILSWPYACNRFKGVRPPRSPQGQSIPKRTLGGSDPWILSHPNFRSGPLIPLMLYLEGWVFEFYFHNVWGLVPILFYIRGFSPLYFSSNLHFWLEREQNQPWLMKATAKLASNCNGYTVTKVYKVYFIEHCWHIYQIHRYKSPHLETLLFLNFHVKILKSTQAKGCQILYFFCSRIAAST